MMMIMMIHSLESTDRAETGDMRLSEFNSTLFMPLRGSYIKDSWTEELNFLSPDMGCVSGCLDCCTFFLFFFWSSKCY